MAEEYVSLPDSPDVSRSWRRISTGKLSLLYSEERVLPNYLRASTGSCHDVCKYGKENESEEKATVSTLKRVPTKLFRDKIPSQSLDSPLVKRTLSKKVAKPSSRSGKCDSSGSDVKSEVRRFSGRTGDVKKREPSSGVSTKGLASANNKNSPEKMKKKTVSSSESRLASSIMRKQKASQSSDTVFLPPGQASSGSKETTEHNKRSTLSKLKSVAEKESAVRHSRRENNIVARKKTGVPKADPKKVVLQGRASFTPKRLPDRSGSLKVKKGSSLCVPPLKIQKEVTTSKAKKSGLKAKQQKEHKDIVEEKTLYVIKMETENAIVESAQNKRCVIDSPTTDPSLSSSPQRLTRRKKSQEKSECIVTDAEDESSGNQEKPDFAVIEGGEEEDLDDDDKDDEDGDDASLTDGKKVPRQRKNRAFSSEDTVKDKAMKLKFKRGKVVDVASRDNSPRRLKFKRGRVLVGDDSTPKSSGRRSFKTKGNHLNNDEHKPGSEKVALKHQEDTQRKQDSRGLFNNVIEETASKLVETRKSKVKALVGAFETVISLQENKSSAT